jgi:TIR domain/Pentapeptide repeats (8 copies)
MANPEHLKILKQEVAAWNQWREDSPEEVPDLSGVDLSGANLRGKPGPPVALEIKLVRSAEHQLIGASLEGADFVGTNLSGTDLKRANLTGADLSRANLSRADLRWTNLSKTILTQADLTAASAQSTILADVDLSTVRGLERVMHVGPSTIGIDTIYRSKGKISEAFLKPAGVPEGFIRLVRPLVASGFYRSFISYSIRDEEFSKQLYDDLWLNGVQCWRFPEDAKGGEPVWGEIDRAIGEHEKVLVICSANSLQSPPVLREIERALQREDREKKNILFPIAIDNYLFKDWNHPRKADVVAVVVRDFINWKDRDIYRQALERLLRDLKAEKSEDKTA